MLRARELVAENPGNERLERLLRDARVARLLDQGRQQVFLGEEEQGLELFREAEAIDPTSAIVQSWIGKTRKDLAIEWLDGLRVSLRRTSSKRPRLRTSGCSTTRPVTSTRALDWLVSF